MMIRNGFVTNSSSTNYIIISKDNLTPEGLANMLGATKDSPFYNDVLLLTQDLINNSGYLIHATGSDMYEQVKSIFGAKTQKEYKKAIEKKYQVIYGSVSDDEAIKAGFALDCCKIKSDEIIIDFSEWGY